MRVLAVTSALLAGALVSCGESPCQAPEGCLSAGRVDGTCQCLEWQVVSVENAPVKFVVVSVVYAIPGDGSEACYGLCNDVPAPRSEIGSRWRSVVRAPDGSEQVAALGRLDVGQSYWVAHRVTATSGAVSVDPASGTGHISWQDVPSKERDFIQLWVNPVATVVTDYAGNRSVDWSWSGSCFGVACTGAMVLWLHAGELDGTVPPTNPLSEMFLATLTAAEHAAILRYHPLYDPPGRDPATLASDPRFLALGEHQLPNWPSGSVQNAQWMPCVGTLSDAEFPILGQTEVPFGGGTLVIQHSVQSISPTCEAQKPKVTLSASTQCVLTAWLYVDQAFGTVLGVPASASPGCTGP